MRTLVAFGIIRRVSTYDFESGKRCDGPLCPRADSLLLGADLCICRLERRCLRDEPALAGSFDDICGHILVLL